MASLRHSLFADFVAPGDGGKITVVGIFEKLTLSREQLGKVVGAFFFFIQIEWSIAEGSHHDADFAIVDGNGDLVGHRFRYPKIAGRSGGPGLPLSARIITQMSVAFPDFGDFTVEVKVDGVRIGGALLSVVERAVSPS